MIPLEAGRTEVRLVLPRPVAESLTGWLDEIAESERDYYATNAPDQVGEPEPLDAAHGAATIAQAWLAATQPTAEPAHPDQYGAAPR